MKVTEEKLKELYQQQTARPASRRTECPTEEMLVGAFAGQLNQAEYQTVTKHLLRCSSCAQEYHLLYALQPLAKQLAASLHLSAIEEKGVAEPVGCLARIRTFWQQRVWTSQWRAVALVTIVVIAIGGSVALWQWTRMNNGPTPYRGDLSLTMNVEPRHQAVQLRHGAAIGHSRSEYRSPMRSTSSLISIPIRSRGASADLTK